MDTQKMLETMASSFQRQIDKDYSCNIQLHIEDTKELYSIKVEKGEVQVTKRPISHVNGELTTTSGILNNIFSGKMTAFTAASKEHVSDSAPLDWKLTSGYSPETVADLYFFLMHFFNTTNPEKIKLGEEYSRLVHGGHAIPLYYHPGFRSAWYMIKKGEKLNEQGDTNPFPQAMVIIKGRGLAKIGEQTVQITSNESYYIPPHADHVIWTESEGPLVLIWLAWGEGA